VNSNNDEAGNLAIDAQGSYDEIMKHEEEKHSLKASLEAYIQVLTVHLPSLINADRFGLCI